MNIYSVLDESDDEEQKPQPPKSVPAKKAKDTPASKPVKVEASKPASAPQQAASAPSAKPPRSENAPPSNKEGKPRKEVTEKPKAAPGAPAEADGEVVKDNNRGGHYRGKDHGTGRRNGRPRENEDGERRPRREYDRRSSSGRGREVSRGGRGPYNSGNVQQDALEAEKHPDAVENTLEPHEAVPGEAAPESAEPAEDANATPTEPETVTYTLDEFWQQKNEARAKAAAIGLAKARAVDSSLPGLAKKADSEEVYMEGTKTSQASTSGKKEQQKSSSKTQVDVAFKFEPQTDSFRGGRGAGRGDRGERGDRGQRNDRTRRPDRDYGNKKESAPAVIFSPQDFPTLQTTV